MITVFQVSRKNVQSCLIMCASKYDLTVAGTGSLSEKQQCTNMYAPHWKYFQESIHIFRRKTKLCDLEMSFVWQCQHVRQMHVCVWYLSVYLGCEIAWFKSLCIVLLQTRSAIFCADMLHNFMSTSTDYWTSLLPPPILDLFQISALKEFTGWCECGMIHCYVELPLSVAPTTSVDFCMLSSP